MIDLRSDTVTRPSAAMRKAMAEAEVGDDVYGEDPTINRLEQRAAEICGKEAALFVPTGTMANTIADQDAHRAWAGSHLRSTVPSCGLGTVNDGLVLRLSGAHDRIRRWDSALERDQEFGEDRNSSSLAHRVDRAGEYSQHGWRRGVSLEVVDEVCQEAHALGIKVHMDGARVFNAACALGRPVRDILAPVDSAMFCLSKGLGAPVGSMVVGTAEGIEQGRLYRKRLGGGMRQAGVLAAAGLIALEDMPKRLPEDHANARMIAEALAKLPGIRLDASRVQTNIVIFDVTGTGMSSTEFAARAGTAGLRLSTANPARVRIVTHCDVTRADCERAIEIISGMVSGLLHTKVGAS